MEPPGFDYPIWSTLGVMLVARLPLLLIVGIGVWRIIAWRDALGCAASRALTGVGLIGAYAIASPINSAWQLYQSRLAEFSGEELVRPLLNFAVLIWLLQIAGVVLLALAVFEGRDEAPER